MSIPNLYAAYMNFDPSGVEVAGWLLQFLLIVLVVWGGSGIRKGTLPEPSAGACFGVICLAWAWRMSHLFVLASGDFTFWMGDDTRRFINAFRWSTDPYFLLPLPDNAVLGPGPEVPATHVVHGLMMMLFDDPLVGSKLASSVYNVIPLAGVFLFANAVFRNRLLACAAVLFLGPHWLQVFWGSGTLTELPMTGLLLAGGAFAIESFRRESGHRTRHAIAAAVLLALATTFHLTAWIYLGGILAVALAAFALRKGYRDRREIASTAILVFGSPLFCLIWMFHNWFHTDRPFFFMAELANLDFYKIGGPVPLSEAFVTVFAPVTPAYRWLYGFFVSGALALVVLELARRSSRGRLRRLADRLGAVNLRRIQIGAGVIMAACAIAAVICRPFWGPAFLWPPNSVVLTDLKSYPQSIVFTLRFILPLLVLGLVYPWLRREEKWRFPRWMLPGLAAILGLFTWTALRGGTNLTPFRTMAPLSAALIPYALAPLLLPHAKSPDDAEGRDFPFHRSWREPVFAVLVLLSAGFYLADNSSKLETRRSIQLYVLHNFGPEFLHDTNRVDSDLYALGAWVRRESIDPRYLSSRNWKQPFRVWIPPGGFFDARGDTWRIIVHAIGNPSWLEHHDFAYQGKLKGLLKDLRPGQVLIATEPVDSPRLRRIVRLGTVFVYEGRE